MHLSDFVFVCGLILILCIAKLFSKRVVSANSFNWNAKLLTDFVLFTLHCGTEREMRLTRALCDPPVFLALKRQLHFPGFFLIPLITSTFPG